MMKSQKLYSLCYLLFLLICPFAFSQDSLSTSVMTQQQAKITEGDGWVFYEYFTADTYGTKNALTGMAIIQPGKEIHPAHEHFEEEYLMLTQGSGVWTIEGKESDAKTGDILYAAPWDSHGIKNTGDQPLVFVVMKWQSKGVPEPQSK
ncbi:cupin domain-containing protein [Aliiglaciecola lipolytica]|nr:cupin domain-containing protein [Aliiglaciecola lipolytica]